MVDPRSPVRLAGHATRGTTNPNRLRRFDRWYCRTQAGPLRRAEASPLLVDLGYGRSPVTVVELLERAARVRADVRVLGVEIDPERVREAELVRRDGLAFAHGGFELAPVGADHPLLVRAFNVLRQYDESAVAAAWDLMTARLAPDGIAVDGTCDELGRLASWVVLDGDGPRCLVLAYRLAGLTHPGTVAARLPKALIHRNLAPHRVHAFLLALGTAWEHEAARGSYGARQRFAASCGRLVAAGWSVRVDEVGWREGVLEVAWPAVSEPLTP